VQCLSTEKIINFQKHWKRSQTPTLDFIPCLTFTSDNSKEHFLLVILALFKNLDSSRRMMSPVVVNGF
jgi:hypothetical protein